MILTSRRGTRRARSEHWRRREAVSGFRPVWRDAAEGAGLCRRVNTPTGSTISVPEVVDVTSAGGDPVLVVRLLAGQLITDVHTCASRLAPALGALRVAVEPVGLTHARLTLLSHDPLAESIPLPEVVPDGLLGYGEDAQALCVPIAERPHTVVQGQTGSGKSRWTYGQLAAAAADPAVLVAGIDPTGLLFRPFTGSRHAPWQVGGLSPDLAAHLSLLWALCDEMDRRIAAMPPDRDAVVPDCGCPALLVVLEELAGLYRAADIAGRDTGRQVRALVARLLSEGRKGGLRVLLIVQRADAAIIDGLARAQCGLRISFSVDSAEAVRMLHPAVPDPAELLAAAPAIGLLTAPGAPLTRFRAPGLGSYADYVARVSQAISAPNPAT